MKLENHLHAAKTEVADLQAEFEREREDMLETIRRQEQQLRLATQILDKVSMLFLNALAYHPHFNPITILAYDHSFLVFLLLVNYPLIVPLQCTLYVPHL